MYRGDLFFECAQRLRQREIEVVLEHYNSTSEPLRPEEFDDWLHRHTTLTQQYWEAAIVCENLHPRPRYPVHEQGA